MTPEIESINQELGRLHQEHHLVDHAQLNRERFNWIGKLKTQPPYYGARTWEFPFAILAGDLKEGMKVADVGCGNTPFTAYLAQRVGSKNVTGYDPDYIVDDSADSHSHFGARKSFIDKLGINFYPEGITKMTAPDNYYDRVFCISVLEHIDDIRVKQQGIREMARMVKPGGLLIMTFDLGIDNPLNNILNIIQYSGLVPRGGIDLKFPRKRFVDYGNGNNVDVFGLVLEKSDDRIFTDHSEKKEIPQYEAYDKYAKLAEFYAVDYNSMLAARDLRSRFGPLKVFLKSILGKYRN
jgi:2-polyprenyl-3-methyl-5-hydroxy-6-metoxy-1,4-benzoquinol methylase